MRSTTWLDIVILAFFSFGVTSGGFKALLFLTRAMVVVGGELNKLCGMGVTRGTAMEENAEFEAWNSVNVGNKVESLVKVWTTQLKLCTFVFSYSMIGVSYSHEILAIASSDVSPCSGSDNMPSNE